MRNLKQGRQRVTPATHAGLNDTLWTMEDLYDTVMKQQARKKQWTQIDKLLKKLRSL